MSTTTSMTRSQGRIFVLLTALSIVLWWRPLVATLRLALGNDAYTHILLILPWALALIYSASKETGWTARVIGSPNAAVGLPLLLIALVLAGSARSRLAGQRDDLYLSLSVLALVIWWIGSVVSCFDIRAFKTFLFPLCFLFLMVPLPDSIVSWVVNELQYQSTVASELMFRLAGVSVIRDGTKLFIPGLEIEVVQECSSIRSSQILIVTTVILAVLFLRSWWARLFLIAISVPLSVAKNGLRIFTIAELGTRIDPSFLDGWLHHHGGIVFYALSVAFVVGLIALLSRLETRRDVRAAFAG